jgi:hypothetical protein
MRTRASTGRHAGLAALCATLALTVSALSPPSATATAEHPHRSRVVLTGYDRDQVLQVDGKPFFYNGVQYRIDKNRVMFGHGYADIERLMKAAKALGYSVVSGQILWSDIQPDTQVPSSEAAYIANGENANTNYDGEVQTSYEPGQPDNQSLALVKFQIPKDYRLPLHGVKIRIRTATAQSTAQGLKVYAIDNDWDASKLTWANAGFEFDGRSVTRDGEVLEPVSVLPSWDQITSAFSYDLDVTEYVADAQARGQDTVSFLLQDATPGTTPTQIVTPSDRAFGPRLILSSKERYTFAHLDKVVELARRAGVKFEIIWFGADSTGITADDRAPHYALAEYDKSLKPDGTPYFRKINDPRYGPYRYLLDKADKDLQAQEAHVLRRVFDHLARTDRDSTVVGVQPTNEPQIVQLNGAWQTDATGNPITHSYSASSVARWERELAQAKADGTYTTEAAFAEHFRAKLMWEYNNRLAKAVKTSAHPVWTRVNQHMYNDAKGTLAYNEAQRAEGGTHLDFIGLDPYRIATQDVYRLGHAPYYDTSRSGVILPNYATGENLTMAMENGGDYPNIGKLIVATLAGGAFNVTYDLCGADEHSVLNESVHSDYDGVCTAEGMRRKSSNQQYDPYAYADKIKALTGINKALLKVGYDLATKQSDGAGGTKLKFFNPTADSDNQPVPPGTQITKAIRSVDVTYTVDESQGTGVAIERAANEIALLNLGARPSTFRLEGLAKNIASVQSGSYDRFETAATENRWKADADQSGATYVLDGKDVLVTVPHYAVVRVLTRRAVPAADSYLFEGEGLNYRGVVDGPYGLTTKDDKFYRDGAHGGYWLQVDGVDAGDQYTFTIPVPAGITKARIVTRYRGAPTGRGTAQLSVNGTAYGAPINQTAPTVGFYESAPHEVVRLKPETKNVFTYKAMAGSGPTLSFDYIEVRPLR